MEFVSIDQKNIVMDRARIRKVSGCAGSRKTDTLIKCGIHFLQKKKKPHNCLFLTLVGSVTDEITERISKMLGIKIDKQGISNHYIGYWKNHIIEIANYDAFIHKQLEKYDDIDILSNDFELKSQKLLQYIKDGHQRDFFLKNNDVVDMVLMDEFQDVSLSRAEILIEFFKRNKKTQLVVMGDILQTIFPQAIVDMKHPLTMIDELRPSEFRLNICFRCPKSHLNVVNTITKSFRAKYSIPEMESHFDLSDIKPLFFTHDTISSHIGAYDTASTVYKMIQCLIEKDSEIQYNDIVIIMKKSNYQLVFHHLLQIFEKNEKGDKCLLSNTKTLLNEHQPINWKDGKEKLMMLSIHGDKGKGHPVVFFLGFSGNAIPEERHFHKSLELLSQSLVNVALTRSTKYLFIGMTRTNPSFYFYQSYSELKPFAYFSWHQDEISNPIISNICKLCLKGNHNPIITRYNIRKQTLDTPIRNIIYIHQDEYSKQWIKKPKILKKKIGIKSKLDFSDEILLILHSLSKLIFLKKIKPKLIKSIFLPFLECLQREECYYTMDENILHICKDHYLNRNMKDETYWLSVIHKNGIKNMNSPKLILHHSFQCSLLENLNNFMNNDKLCLSELWNVGIFYLENFENLNIHNIISLVNKPICISNCDFLFHNIETYIDYYKTNFQNAFKRFRFHQQSRLINTIYNRNELEKIGFQIDLDIDKKFFTYGYKFGISSLIDFIDLENKILIDFKIYTKNEFKDEWCFQNILNSLLSQIDNFVNIRQVHIFNVFTGILYIFRISKKNSLSDIIPNWLKHYEFKDFLIEKLQQKII